MPPTNRPEENREPDSQEADAPRDVAQHAAVQGADFLLRDCRSVGHQAVRTRRTNKCFSRRCRSLRRGRGVHNSTTRESGMPRRWNRAPSRRLMMLWIPPRVGNRLVADGVDHACPGAANCRVRGPAQGHQHDGQRQRPPFAQRIKCHKSRARPRSTDFPDRIRRRHSCFQAIVQTGDAESGSSDLSSLATDWSAGTTCNVRGIDPGSQVDLASRPDLWHFDPVAARGRWRCRRAEPWAGPRTRQFRCSWAGWSTPSATRRLATAGGIHSTH